MDFLVSPNGRFSRWQYWFVLLTMPYLQTGFLVFVVSLYDRTDPPSLATLVFTGLVMFTAILFAAWSCICATMKRYHDMGMSGWWWLVVFIPVVGPIWQVIECGFVSGEDVDNAYGPARTTGIEEEIAQLRANRDLGRPPTPAEPLARRREFETAPRPLFGNGSKA
jgi:uncharacterized membrane protein YhaH (DUF805 family)